MMIGQHLGTDRSKSYHRPADLSVGLKKQPTSAAYRGMTQGNTAKEHRARIVRGIQAARAKGRMPGRPKRVWSEEELRTARTFRQQGKSIKAIAKMFGSSKRTVGRMLLVPERKTPRNGMTARPVESRSLPAMVKAKLEQIARLQEEVAALEKAHAILMGSR